MNWAGDSALIPARWRACDQVGARAPAARAEQKIAERLLSGRSALSEPVQFCWCDSLMPQGQAPLCGVLRILDPLKNHGLFRGVGA